MIKHYQLYEDRKNIAFGEELVGTFFPLRGFLWFKKNNDKIKEYIISTF